MQLSQAGIGRLRASESLRLNAYQDTGGVWTIGWGSTGPDIVEGLVWTRQQADERFARDCSTFAAGVSGAIHVAITQNMFDALVCLAYNIGLHAFQTSTLLKRLNASDYIGAADQFLCWNKDNGKILRGLTERRQAERKLFLSGIGVSKYE